jgi:ABC-2 type transport system ATP-binding protein
VGETRVDGTRVSARADDGATALPAVLAALESAGVAVRAATVARPSLDDVYLRHAGRRFAEADQPTTAVAAPAGGSR